MTFTYLLLNIFTISVPLARSFEPQINFVGKWKYLLPAIAAVGAFFIVWDVWFTHLGVWGFNERYLTGIDLINLPLEEWLFFLTVPYACVFIYEVLNYFIKEDVLAKVSRPITIGLILLLGTIAVTHSEHLYTFITFSLCTVFLLLHLLVFKVNYLGRFYLAFAVSLLPFFLVNGILTGSFIEEQVVWYNNAENLSIRLFTIPIEDTMYAMLLLMMVVTLYEYLKGRE